MVKVKKPAAPARKRGASTVRPAAAAGGAGGAGAGKKAVPRRAAAAAAGKKVLAKERAPAARKAAASPAAKPSRAASPAAAPKSAASASAAAASAAMSPAAVKARALKYATDFVLVEVARAGDVEGVLAALAAQHPLKTATLAEAAGGRSVICHWPDFCQCGWSALGDGRARSPADAVAALLAHGDACRAPAISLAALAKKRAARGSVPL